MGKLAKWVSIIIGGGFISTILGCIGAIVSCLALALLVILLPMLMIGSLFGGSGVHVTVGPVNLTTFAKAPAGTMDQIYPTSPVLTHEINNDSYVYPIPPYNTFIADLAIGTPYQMPIIGPNATSNCYTAWAVPAQYGGGYCPSSISGGFSGYPGQCTFWALLNWNNPLIHKLSGYAYQYYANAKALGAVETSIPTVGAIVVWNKGGGYSTSAGHVAIVVAVNPANKTFVVSEMNYFTPWMIDYRVVSDTPGGNGYGNLEGFILPE